MKEIPIAAVPAHFAAKKGDDAICLSIDDGALTWGELDRLSDQIANLLVSKGVSHDDFVTIALPNTLNFFAAVFGVHKASAIPQVISPNLPLEEAGAMLALARPRVVIGDIGAGFDTCHSLPSDFSVDGVDASKPDYKVTKYWKAMSSGGSTGQPKIIVSHEPALAKPDTPVFGIHPGDNVLTCGPFYHNSPYLTGMLALCRGCHLFATTKFDPERTLSLIERHKINWAAMVPTMMHRIWRLPEEVRKRYDLSSLRMVTHTAAPIAPWLKEAWIDWLGAERVYEAYGGTEATGITFMDGHEWLAHRGSVGRFSDGTKIRILSDDGDDLKAGEIGEIYLQPGGDPQKRTYHYVGAEEKTLPGGWHSLGDIGWVDDDNYLYLADRRTDLIISGGANIFPAEIEAALQAFPGVVCAVAIGLPDDDLGAKVHAIIQYDPVDEPPVETQLRSFIKEKLAFYKNPRSYEFTTTPLRDDAGKVRRRKLREDRS